MKRGRILEYKVEIELEESDQAFITFCGYKERGEREKKESRKGG